MPILVGILHLVVHFTELTLPSIQSKLTLPIEINGQTEQIWNVWGLMSFMMGWAFVIIGLLNGTTYLTMARTDWPNYRQLFLFSI